MKTLSQIKQEASEKLDSLIANGSRPRDRWEFLDETLDRLVDEIEKAVVPEERDETSEGRRGFNSCRELVEEAFTRFKGESECIHENNGKDFCKKCGACLLPKEESHDQH